METGGYDRLDKAGAAAFLGFLLGRMAAGRTPRRRMNVLHAKQKAVSSTTL
jgi:hypothetical protein